MTEIDELKKKISEYESLLGVNDKDVAKDAFLAYCKIVKMYTAKLNKFNLDTEIGKDPKEDKVYDRVTAIVKEMPSIILDISKLRKELNISKDLDEAYVDGIADNRK